MGALWRVQLGEAVRSLARARCEDEKMMSHEIPCRDTDPDPCYQVQCVVASIYTGVSCLTGNPLVWAKFTVKQAAG